MFVRQKAYQNAIQTVTINFGSLLGDEYKDEDAGVTLKELPTLEMMKMSEAKEQGQVKLLEYFKEVLPEIITDHNLYETEDKKMEKKDVAELIFDKFEITVKVVNEYCSAAFFTRLNKKEGK